MNLYLSKREKMKKISLILLGFLTVINLYSQEQSAQNMDKLDALDQQSKEFFKAITGLEKDYLEEQVNAIKNKKVEQNINPNIPNQPQVIIKEEPKLEMSEECSKHITIHNNLNHLRIVYEHFSNYIEKFNKYFQM